MPISFMCASVWTIPAVDGIIRCQCRPAMGAAERMERTANILPKVATYDSFTSLSGLIAHHFLICNTGWYSAKKAGLKHVVIILAAFRSVLGGV